MLKLASGTTSDRDLFLCIVLNIFYGVKVILWWKYPNLMKTSDNGKPCANWILRRKHRNQETRRQLLAFVIVDYFVCGWEPKRIEETPWKYVTSVSQRIQSSPVWRLRFQTPERGLKSQPPNGRRLYPLATLPLVSGNTSSTSLPLVSARRVYPLCPRG